jgi:hypothetical protein
MSAKGDFAKLRTRAEAAGWRVVEKKETWLFYPPVPEGVNPRSDRRYAPCRHPHTPSSQATIRNFKACLERKGLR